MSPFGCRLRTHFVRGSRTIRGMVGARVRTHVAYILYDFVLEGASRTVSRIANRSEFRLQI